MIIQFAINDIFIAISDECKVREVNARVRNEWWVTASGGKRGAVLTMRPVVGHELRECSQTCSRLRTHFLRTSLETVDGCGAQGG